MYPVDELCSTPYAPAAMVYDMHVRDGVRHGVSARSGSYHYPFRVELRSPQTIAAEAEEVKSTRVVWAVLVVLALYLEPFLPISSAWKS